MLAPSRGLVVHLAYLRARKQRAGAVEGRKDRSCLIVDVETRPDGPPVVGVQSDHALGDRLPARGRGGKPGSVMQVRGNRRAVAGSETPVELARSALRRRW